MTDFCDEHFQGTSLKTAFVDFTCEQVPTAEAHKVMAIHTKEDGTTHSFWIEVGDPQRRKVFTTGLGSALQKVYISKCDEALKQSNEGEAKSTPDPLEKAIRGFIMGTWAQRDGEWVFQLGLWAWPGPKGKTLQGGRMPILKSKSDKPKALEDIHSV